VTTKEALHRLIDELPEPDLAAVQRFAEYLRFRGRDPVARALERAPADDEPLSADELAAAERAREAYRRGEWVAGEDVRREIGW
jgi:hypothetical protein